MDPVWKHWCRLCSRENGDQIEVLVKDEEVSDLSMTISKFFLVNITPFDDLPKMICNRCHKFVTNIVRVNDRISKVQLMYNEMQFDDKFNALAVDLKILRNKFGITIEEFESASNSLEPNLLNLESVKADSPKSKFSTNPLEPEDGMAEFQYLEMGFLDVKIVKEENMAETDQLNNDNEIDENVDCENIEEIEILDTAKEFENSDNDNDSDNIEYSPKTKKSRSPTTSTATNSKTSYSKGKSVKSVKSVQYNCEECSKPFKRESHYRQHMKNSHNVEINPPVYACSKCDKIFATQRRLDNHEFSHLPLEMKLNVPCPYCDKKFTKEVSVKSHIKSIHMNEKPFICEECGKAFKTIGALKEHKFTHIEESPFQCSHCEKTFKNKARLKTHEDTHNDTIYVCTICGLQLNTRRTLKMHMLVHSDQKRHKCHYCGNEFKRAKALKNHLILHTGLKPYTCNFCDKTFANGSNCRSHKKKTHPKELAAMEAAGAKSCVTNMPKLEQLRAVAAIKPIEPIGVHGISKPELLINSNCETRNCELQQEKGSQENMGLYVKTIFDSLS